LSNQNQNNKVTISPDFCILKVVFLTTFPKAAGQGCRARLPGKAARQGCRARLPGKAAGQSCNMLKAW
jgi:hypothetical protein